MTYTFKYIIEDAIYFNIFQDGQLISELVLFCSVPKDGKFLIGGQTEKDSLTMNSLCQFKKDLEEGNNCTLLCTDADNHVFIQYTRIDTAKGNLSFHTRSNKGRFFMHETRVLLNQAERQGFIACVESMIQDWERMVKTVEDIESMQRRV